MKLIWTIGPWVLVDLVLLESGRVVDKAELEDDGADSQTEVEETGDETDEDEQAPAPDPRTLVHADSFASQHVPTFGFQPPGGWNIDLGGEPGWWDGPGRDVKPQG